MFLEIELKFECNHTKYNFGFFCFIIAGGLMSINSTKEAAKSLAKSLPKTTAKRKFEEVVLAKCLASKKAKTVIAETTTGGVAENTGVILAEEAVGNTAVAITGGTAENAVAPIGKDTAPVYKVNTIGLAIDCVVEAGFTVHDIAQLKRQRDHGQITEDEFTENSIARVGAGTGSVALSTIGATLLSPIPVIGPLVGGACGSGLGTIVGDTFTRGAMQFCKDVKTLVTPSRPPQLNIPTI